MVTTHNLGFPRIGAARELKFALESYWNGQLPEDQLLRVGGELRERHWRQRADLDWIPVGDFSFHDQVLDMSFTLGNVPSRITDTQGSTLQHYFRNARGRLCATASHTPPPGRASVDQSRRWAENPAQHTAAS